MKFLTFEKDNVRQVGIKTEDGILSLNDIYKNDEYNDMIEVIKNQGEIKAEIEKNLNKSINYIKEEEITFAPAINPKKIICVGLNYKKHAKETGASIPTSPILFNKFNNSVAAHDGKVKLPKTSNEVDYEAELGIVIGKETREVSQEKALDHVFGYCVTNDLSARDLQMKTPQWMLGKVLDDFCPIGPYLVTAEEVGDPNNLSIKTYVNGEVKQDSNTSDMIFNCRELVSYISQYITLEPGDLIITGTPEGVVLGLPEEDRVWLKDGDEVAIEIEKLGRLVNVMIEENE